MPLTYREHRPAPALAAHVECFWTLDGVVDEPPTPDRVLPDGRPELIWNLGDRFRRFSGGVEPRWQESALLVGQITSPIQLGAGRQVSLVAVRFRPAALGSFLGGMAAAELTDLDVRLDDVVGRRLRDVEERLAAQEPGHPRMLLLEQLLAADLARAPALDQAVTAAVDLIVGSHGRVRVDSLAQLTGTGRRQLERAFQSAVGIGPKRLARIARFQHLLARLNSSEPTHWGGLAVACGYYDQAHLIRDFREFACCTPGEYLALDGGLGQLFLMDPSGG